MATNYKKTRCPKTGRTTIVNTTPDKANKKTDSKQKIELANDKAKAKAEAEAKAKAEAGG